MCDIYIVISKITLNNELDEFRKHKISNNVVYMKRNKLVFINLENKVAMAIKICIQRTKTNFREELVLFIKLCTIRLTYNIPKLCQRISPVNIGQTSKSITI